MPSSVPAPRRAIVTGGATNIGLAITEALLAAGVRVAVGQLHPEVAEPLVARSGGRVVAFGVDVGDPAQCRAFVDRAAAALGGLDLLVNNAGITGLPAISDLPDITPAHFQQVVAVNLAGPVFLAQAAVPHFKAAGGGVIVNISSINAYRPQRHALVYAATKAGLVSVTQSLAKELARDRIRVVAVAPGDIRVSTSDQMAEVAAKGGVGSDVMHQTPLGAGEPADIAATVAFLCSPAAKFVTGSTWVVDGGLLA
jgi:D-sorbitol dehydrogenase (acceptor)